MTQLTFNNQQLLFVRVPMETENHRIDGKFIGYTNWDGYNKISLPRIHDYEYLGTIQKSNGQVTASIEDEVLEGLTEGGEINWSNYVEKGFDYEVYKRGTIFAFVKIMEASGLPLKEGDKYAVLKIK